MSRQTQKKTKSKGKASAGRLKGKIEIFINDWDRPKETRSHLGRNRKLVKKIVSEGYKKRNIRDHEQIVAPIQKGAKGTGKVVYREAGSVRGGSGNAKKNGFHCQNMGTQDQIRQTKRGRWGTSQPA